LVAPRTTHYMRGLSSIGRAPALQAGGQGFDSPRLHKTLTGDKNSVTIEKFQDSQGLEGLLFLSLPP
jgi:hypothetical protein